jgi:hypothetical protein
MHVRMHPFWPFFEFWKGKWGISHFFHTDSSTLLIIIIIDRSIMAYQRITPIKRMGNTHLHPGRKVWASYRGKFKIGRVDLAVKI